MRAALAREFQHIAKTGGGDQPGARPFAFEHGIGGERGAQHQKRDILARDAVLIEQLGDAVEDAARRIAGGGGHLVIAVTPAVEIGGHQIGKRAAGINAYEKLAHCFSNAHSSVERTRTPHRRANDA